MLRARVTEAALLPSSSFPPSVTVYPHAVLIHRLSVARYVITKAEFLALGPFKGHFEEDFKRFIYLGSMSEAVNRK